MSAVGEANLAMQQVGNATEGEHDQGWSDVSDSVTHGDVSLSRIHV